MCVNKLCIINCVLTQNEDKTINVETNDNKTEENVHKIQFSSEHNLTCDLELLKDIFNFVPDVTKITCLKLTTCNLSTLPDCLSYLHLKCLDLSQNKFETFPDCLTIGLNEIVSLNMSDNRLNDIDVPPKCCSMICDLNISKNNLKYLPAWLNGTDCSNLKLLDLSKNLISSYLYLDMFKSLEKLYIHNTKLITLNIIYSIRGLKRLSIGNQSNELFNSFNHVVFNNFVSSSTLIELDLSSIGLSKLSDDLNVLVNLEILILTKNNFYELPKIQNVKLKILDVSYNGLLEISDLPENLSELYINNNVLSSLSKLSVLKNLQILDVYDNYITEPPFDILKNIQAIDFEQNCFSTDCFNENYEQQKKLLRQKLNVGRYNGEKLFSDNESLSDSRSIDYEGDYVNNVVVDQTEENWDNYETDDDLVLEPLEVIKIPKKRNVLFYNDVYFDSSVYDDAPDDTSDVNFK